ncbi:MAG: SUMF1/EgtB/PvdO family nonheme iron enzyme [Mastigocoleus sp. MO_167.B18]|nr:SUMF1/EgtB/PvdO family nonheme iron enzyme [Mastigocoleus sp. MO_167.B18]
MTEFPLLDLFLKLRETGLPLIIDQYYLAVDALSQSVEAGLDISDPLAVKQMCSTLWVKSRQQKKLFDECWEDWKGNSAAVTMESKSLVTEQTPPDQETSQESIPPEADNPVEPVESDSQEPEEEDELFSPIPSQEKPKVVTSIATKLKEKDYFPVSRANLQQTWRSLMQKSPEVIPSELDIAATVIDICKRGFFSQAIFTAAKTKEEVVLLIDQEGSMVPFHPFCRHLVKYWKDAKIYYFRNSPTDELYRDPKFWDGESIKSILKKFSPEHTLIIIVSDAGAARQRSVYSRYEETYDFLEILTPKAQRLAWLNPLPRFRWQDNTAEEIAKIDPQVPMFALEPREYRQMVQWLLYGKSVKKFLENANEKAKEEGKKHQFDGSKLWDLGFDATGRIEFFKEQFGESHLDFASHGAFPLVLTPDLLYSIRERFFAKPSKVPWYAVADLLLSDLCQQVDSESGKEKLYEMEREIRNQLLKRCEEKTLKELSIFLIEYINHQLDKKSELYELQQWTALAYTEPNKAAKRLAEKLQRAYSQLNKPELIRLCEVTKTFVEPLKGYEPLLVVARGYAAAARGDEAGAQDSQNELKQKHSLVDDQISVAGVLLEVPDIVKSRLKKFSFETVTVNRRGEIIKGEHKQARYFTENLDSTNNITLDMVYIPGGTFMMGSPEGEGRDSEKPQHEVTVPAFFMGKYQVTQEQWKAVANLPQVERELNPEPSRFKGNTLPVEQVSWYYAEEFCKRLSQHTGRQYRLPSEAEWEYACRAGTTTPFHFGETITSELANYNASHTFADEDKGEGGRKTTPVGQLNKANSFGLYDTHGNIHELCLDGWHNNYEGAPRNGAAWVNNNEQYLIVLRGGSWINNPYNCRSAFRYYDSGSAGRDYIDFLFGFRVVCAFGRALP